MSPNKKVSNLIADFLADHKIEYVFGIIGAGNVHIFDSIAERGFTKIICVHHEQAAVMAMQTYFRVNGIVSACILTTGAGSTNGITGVVGAWADSIPGLIIAGNEHSKHSHNNPLRMWGVQGYDSTQMVSKVTKYAARVTDPKLVVEELERAYAISGGGRPGPVWLEIPVDVQSSFIDSEKIPHFKSEIKDATTPNLKELSLGVLKQITAAKRPLLWIGHGIRLAGAQALVESLVDKLNIPVLASWAGLDLISADHPLFMGSAGVYGQRAANFVLQNCDYLLTIGTRLAIPQVGYDISELARGATIVMNDIDPTEIAKLGDRIKLGIPADAGKFMTALIQSETVTPPRKEEWLKSCQDWRKAYPLLGPEHKDEAGYINSYTFIDKLSDRLKPDQVVVTDMGTALLSGHQNLRLKKGQRLMTSTGLGEMGYGLPAAIGASFGRKKGEVLCLNCDGGMMMNLQELQTIVHHKLPIKIVVFNNDGYLMIKHTQKALFKGRYTGTNDETGVSCPDYTALAKAFKIPAMQIRSWSDFGEVIPKLQEMKGPAICEVFMHPEQYFYPKLSLSVQKDGSLISPPLEDLSPFLPRDELRKNMKYVPIHPKSEKIDI